MPFASLVHDPEPCKTFADLDSRQAHNTRTMDTPNAAGLDSAGLRPLPIEFVDGPDSYSDRVKMLLQERGVSTEQKGHRVILHEDVYSVPGWYSDDQGWRDWTKDQWEADPLAKAMLAHIRKTHGNNLAFVALHRDEKTPHFHVGSVPLVERERQRRGRSSKVDAGKPRPTVTSWALDHRHLRGEKFPAPGQPNGRQKLSAMQDAYHAAIAHLGIDRGLKIADVPLGERKDYRAKATAENEARQRKLEADRADADARIAAARRAELDATLAADECRRQVTAADVRNRAAREAEAAAVLAQAAAKRSQMEVEGEVLRVAAARRRVDELEDALARDRKILEETVAEKIRAGIEDALRTFEQGYNDVIELTRVLRKKLKWFEVISAMARSINDRIWNGPQADINKAAEDGILEVLEAVGYPEKEVPVVSELTPAMRLAAHAAQQARGFTR
jgi:hypothetical protein